MFQLWAFLLDGYTKAAVAAEAAYAFTQGHVFAVRSQLLGLGDSTAAGASAATPTDPEQAEDVPLKGVLDPSGFECSTEDCGVSLLFCLC